MSILLLLLYGIRQNVESRHKVSVYLRISFTVQDQLAVILDSKSGCGESLRRPPPIRAATTLIIPSCL